MDRSWRRYRHRGDPSIVYAARLMKDGETVYARRGNHHVKVSKEFFHEHYEPV